MSLEAWLARLCTELGLDEATVDEAATQVLLDVARDAAHGVERVAAPLTTFALGVAVGRGADLTVAAAIATALLAGPTTPADPGV